jgi:hypothetical protein
MSKVKDPSSGNVGGSGNKSERFFGSKAGRRKVTGAIFLIIPPVARSGEQSAVLLKYGRNWSSMHFA